MSTKLSTEPEVRHLHGEEIVQAEVVGIASIVWNKRGCAANVLPRHKVKNNPAKEWVEVLACIEASDVQIDLRIENVDVVLAVTFRHRP